MNPFLAFFLVSAAALALPFAAAVLTDRLLPPPRR